eukprot:CAMPEP_0113489126 /NCGR_PEP_ID=MMETSP0014_2-20120614/26370_1 /TAXON_ID=2857 /ORGANISM="Nitzschia sp." /LENGTH=259 /DNA_ID=CAMNT_0000382857 /DNA_START=75 /DNA_END=854 /DNA_ORIENTATION=- /assembly_acc=CAM_ASM_000159
MTFNKEEWTLPTPYGALGWWSLIVTFLSFIFFYMSAFACWFSVSRIDTSLKIFIGYWSREIPEIAANDDGRNYCVKWDSFTKENLFDGSWKFGKAIGVMGALVSAIPFFLGLYVICYKVSSRTFSIMACTDVTMSIFSLLLLVGLGSDICKAEDCRIGPGGVLAIVGFLFWLGAGALAYKMRTIALSEEERAMLEAAEYTEDSPPPVHRDLKMIEDGDAEDDDDNDDDDDDINAETEEVAPKPKKKKKKKKKKAEAEEP